MLTTTVFSEGLNSLYAAFGKKCASATSTAIYNMLGGDGSECTDAFFKDAVDRLAHRRRLPENVGLALAELWAEWRAARSMGSSSGGTADTTPCKHCGGKGWITVFCSSRPGVGPAMVRCVCNNAPQRQSMPDYTRETASRIPGASLTDPWAVPGARDRWLAAHRPATTQEDAVPADGATDSIPEPSVGATMDGSPLNQGSPF